MRSSLFSARFVRGGLLAMVSCLVLAVWPGLPVWAQGDRAGGPTVLPHHGRELLPLGAGILTEKPSFSLLAASVQGGAAGSHQETEQSQRPPRGQQASNEQRASAVRTLLERLGVGQGGVVADIGAGNGRDTWTFAEVVGPEGAVYAEEIAEDKVKSINEAAAQRNLTQVHAVLGKTDDPCLEAEKADLAYMHFVYHHVTEPREMLRAIWRALKPGGRFVVVDQRRGTLQDWVPRSQRGEKHFWIAETTVVREAREEGFLFDGLAEDFWPEKDAFVLVFRRPEGVAEPGKDPDRFLPLDLAKLTGQLAPPETKYQRPAFIALGEARAVLPALVQRSVEAGVDIVLEEWATQKDERPDLPEGIQLPSVLTENGDPHLTEPVDVVFFLDTYHLLFHQETLLARLREKLSEGGQVYVLDRRGEDGLSHREASHRRKISPQLVQEEMGKAGFLLQEELPAPAADRFLLRLVPAVEKTAGGY